MLGEIKKHVGEELVRLREMILESDLRPGGPDSVYAGDTIGDRVRDVFHTYTGLEIISAGLSLLLLAAVLLTAIIAQGVTYGSGLVSALQEWARERETEQNRPLVIIEAGVTPTPTPTRRAVPPPANSNAQVGNTNLPFNSNMNSNTGVMNSDAGGLPLNGRVIRDQAPLKTYPGFDSPNKAIFNRGGIYIDKESQTGPWFRVRTSRGTEGWMHGDDLEFDEP